MENLKKIKMKDKTEDKTFVFGLIIARILEKRVSSVQCIKASLNDIHSRISVSLATAPPSGGRKWLQRRPAFVFFSWTIHVFLSSAGRVKPFPRLRPPGEVPAGKSIRHMRQFHSHHNLLSLAQPSPSRLQDPDSQDRRGPLTSALSFSLAGGGGRSSSLSGSTESNIWVKQTPQEESKPAANFWDFFTGKGSGSETMVWWRSEVAGSITDYKGWKCFQDPRPFWGGGDLNFSLEVQIFLGGSGNFIRMQHTDRWEGHQHTETFYFWLHLYLSSACDVTKWRNRDQEVAAVVTVM